MAGTIKGISVSIGGDTVDLKKSLKDVEQTSKSLQSELNAVNKQLKFDPSNSVLLAQKQEILEEKISATKETLKKLEAVQGQVEEQAKKGDLGADKYRAYQREVETTKGVLNNLEKQLDETKDAQSDFGKKVNNTDLSDFKKEVEDVKSAADDLKDSLKKTAIEAGAGIAAAVGGTVAAFKSTDEGYDTIVKKTGATGENLEELKDVADEVFGTIKTDMTSVGTTVGEVNTRFGSTGEELKNLSSEFLKFANINDTDVNDSIAKTSQIMSAWGVETKNTSSLLGLISAKAQATGIPVDTLMESVLSNNAVLKEMGLSLEESISLMAQFEKNGINSSISITAFKTAVKNATKEGVSLESELGKTVNKIKSAKTETEALQIATELFGSKGAAEMTNAIRDGRLSFDDLSTSMTNYNDVVDKTYEATISPAEEAQVAINKVQTAFSKLAEKGLQKAEPIIENAIDGIDWITEHLDDLIPIIKALGKQVAIVWGVKKATEITKGVIKLIDNYKTLATATKAATDGQKGLNAAQKANVIGLVVGAVLSLISAIDSYNETQWENSDLKKEIDKTKELTDEWNDLADSMSSKIEEINDTELDMKVNFEDVNNLKERLQEIIKDGTIDENEKGEYKTIVDLLSEKVDGFETNWNNLTLEEVNGKIVIKDNIDEVNKNLDDLIKKWELTQAKMTMSEIYNSLKTESAKKEIEVEALKDESANSDKSIDNFIKYVYEGSKLSMSESEVVANEIIKANGDLEKASDSIKSQLEKGSLDPKKFKNLYDNSQYVYFNGGYIKSLFNDWKAEERIKEYTNSITDYNKSIKNGETQLSKMKDKTNDLYGSLKILSGGQGTYNDYIKLSTEYGMSHEAVLDLLKDKGIKTWSDLEKAAQDKGDSIVNSSKNTSRNANSAYEREYRPAIAVSKRLDETKSAIENKSVELETATSTTMQNAQNAAKIGGWAGVGGGFIGQIIGGIFGRNGDMENAGQTSAESAKTGAGKVSLFSKGISLVASFISGLFSDKNDPETAGEKVAGKAKTGSNKVSLFSIGNNLVSGFINGILSGEAFKRIGSAAMSVAKNAYDTIKSWLGINSPSKETKKLGKYFSDGFAIGISENAKKATNAAETLANNAQKKLNTVNLSNTLENINGMREIGAKSAGNYSNMKTVNNSPTINANVYLQGTAVRSETDLDLLATKVSDKLGEMIVNKGMEWG